MNGSGVRFFKRKRALRTKQVSCRYRFLGSFIRNRVLFALNSTGYAFLFHQDLEHLRIFSSENIHCLPKVWRGCRHLNELAPGPTCSRAQYNPLSIKNHPQGWLDATRDGTRHRMTVKKNHCCACVQLLHAHFLITIIEAVIK